MDFVIQVDHLSKQFNNGNTPPAVDDLSLSIPGGVLYGLIGPDGAGKTTTLRMLSSVMLPTSGTVSVLGYDTRKNPDPIRKQIGYMPQNFSLYTDLSVIENLNFFADIQQLDSARKPARILEMMRFTRLEEFKHRRAGTLSGGMKKKLALACALVHEPKLLILDEPSTGVDPVSRRELWVILAEVVQNGVTVVVSTPYMDEAERCHEISFLSGGKILATGSPNDLIGKLPFNILELKASPRKKMRQIVDETQGVIEWRPVGDSIRLAVPNNGTTQQIADSLRQQLDQEKMKVTLLRQTRPSMEDVFVHLVNKQRGQA
ncbi:MAG: ABC transporter ATP-binding protein [Chloroflexi bacterium]|nr:ABC transporter ATP-binding protein [Chloroflexota bacterium]